MKTLSNYLKYSETPIYESLSDIQDYSVFLNLFNKIDIYNKHNLNGFISLAGKRSVPVRVKK